MTYAVWVPLLASGLLALAAPGLARHLPPPVATVLLTACGVVAALATGTTVAVLALLQVARVPALAAVGHWSPAAVVTASPVPAAVPAAAVVAVALCAVAGARAVTEHVRSVAAARDLCRRLGGERGGLVVVEEGAEAFAVPARGGRVVVSRLLLEGLPAQEGAALLAHERAHLAHRHHLYRSAARLSAAIDPLLRRLPAAVRYASERWADEDAARAAGDRAVVARALSRAGLLRAGSTPAARPVDTLEAGGADVVARVRALLAPAPQPRPLLVLVALSLVVTSAASAAHAESDGGRVLHRAVQLTDARAGH